MRICALDLGALSFHLLHDHVWPGGRIARIGATKRLIRFGAEFERNGVEPQRADVIGIAAIVVETLMGMLSSPTVEIATRGLREGAVLRELARREAKANTTDSLDQARLAHLTA